MGETIANRGGNFLISISLCMIVKNEEDTLPRCLRSAAGLVDEIVVVDTGSTDRTKEVAREFTDRVFDFPWNDDFSQARNYSFQLARCQYCLWLDADDVIDPEYQQEFQTLKESLPPQTDVVMLPYHGAFDQQGRPVLTYYRERLVRRLAGLVWQGAVHEAIAPVGNVVYWDRAAVSHRKTRPGDGDRNLRILENLLAQGKMFSPREQFYYARELADHGRDQEAAAQLEAFLERPEGWVENKRQACRDLAQCRKRLGQEEAAFAALTRALAYGPPQAELCCDLGQFSWTGRSIRPPCSGMKPPSPVPGRTGPAPLWLRTATGIFPVCSCASVTTAWVIGSWLAGTTRWPALLSRTILRFFPTNGFSKERPEAASGSLLAPPTLRRRHDPLREEAGACGKTSPRLCRGLVFFQKIDYD